MRAPTRPGPLNGARRGSTRLHRACAVALPATILAAVMASAPTRSAEIAFPLQGPAPADRYAGVMALGTGAAASFGGAGAQTRGDGIDRIATGAIQVSNTAPIQPASGSLAQGLDQLYGGSIERARSIREGLPSGSLDREILTWSIALSGKSAVPSADIAAAISQLSGWPGQVSMLENLETALLRENNGPGFVAAMNGAEPRTLDGKLTSARALAASDPARAAALLRPVWHDETLDRAKERAILSWGAPLLRASDHRRRVATLVYRDRITAAERIAPSAGQGYGALVAAAAAVARKTGEERALAAVPSSLRADPIYLFAKARHLRRADRQRAAAATLKPHRINASEAVSPRTWWRERRQLTRELLDQGDARLAYDVAAAHSGGRATDRIEAEFTAGWIALRFLNDAGTARRHFAKVAEVGTRSLSDSRGHYWLGRAEEAAGMRAEAQASFGRAARYRTTYYGQLAMERLGQSGLNVSYPSPSASDRSAFAANRFVQAIDRLEGTAHGWRARTLYRHLARNLPTAGQAALLTARAERQGQFQLGLQMGKSALARGLPAEALAFPTGAIPADAPLSDTGRAFAYAIARQESAFDREAVSGAGARGLLQLMPATAKEVAGWVGVPYSKDRLLSDPGYNAMLGARFLTRLLERFDGSYVLTAVAYNAGPTRANNWKAAYGDPNTMSLDEVVDWVEHIPFSETRNYVQRVMENYQVYRARLEGRPLSLAKDLTRGRG